MNTLYKCNIKFLYAENHLLDFNTIYILLEKEPTFKDATCSLLMVLDQFLKDPISNYRIKSDIGIFYNQLKENHVILNRLDRKYSEILEMKTYSFIFETNDLKIFFENLRTSGITIVYTLKVDFEQVPFVPLLTSEQFLTHSNKTLRTCAKELL